MAEPSLLVLGATGMLGRTAVEQLRRENGTWRIVAASRQAGADYHFDVADGADALQRLLATAACGYVLNAIGVLQGDIDAHRPDSVARAIEVNARFPHVLAVAAARAGCRVFHVSTDAVFSGQTGDDYAESAPVSPVGIYGLSKALGESLAPHVINIRCSIVGRDARGRGLVEWIARPTAEPLTGYVDYVWTPATVPQLVAFMRDIIAGEQFDAWRGAGPIVHYAPNPPLSKFEFVQAVGALVGRTVVPSTGPGGMCRRVLVTGRRYPRSANVTEAVRALFPDATGVDKT